MKKLSVVLLMCACFGSAYAQANKSAASPDVEALKQLEHEWVDAQKAADIEKLGQIIADDWAGLGADGAKSTKKQFLENVKSGASKVESIELGPMDVKMIGTTVAVVQGTDTEKSSMKGKDTSGKWAWSDVFVKRNGKWQAVRSQAAMIK
jgi:Rieske Fe-S protein